MVIKNTFNMSMMVDKNDVEVSSNSDVAFVTG